jgi:3-oxoadipate enol-lactonase
MDVRTISLPGLDVSLAEAGAGGRPLLLVHGFCGAKEDFTEWLDRLAAEGWHAVAYDQRGHGQSGHPEGEASFSLPIMAGDALAVADRLGWQRLVLLGHSMGGMVGQLVALAAPERLAGLVLMDTDHGPLRGFDLALIEIARQIVRSGGMAALVEAQRALEPGALDSPAHLRMCEERPGYREFCEHKTTVASPEMWHAMIGEMLGQPDRLDALAGVTVPALIVVGEQDQAFVGPSEAMAATMTDARLAVIPGGGHSPQFEAAGPWWDAVAKFLTEVPA